MKPVDDSILFFKTKDEYGWLSNFWPSPITIDGVTYPTVEHYYQSQKPTNAQTQNFILNSRTPFLAMQRGRNLQWIRKDWEEVKVDIMRKGIEAKFEQHLDLASRLVATDRRPIHESDPRNKFWGINGKDMLGKILMNVRDRIGVCVDCNQPIGIARNPDDLIDLTIAHREKVHAQR